MLICKGKICKYRYKNNTCVGGVVYDAAAGAMYTPARRLQSRLVGLKVQSFG